eukprot:580633-Amphidinium_carterae.2
MQHAHTTKLLASLDMLLAGIHNGSMTQQTRAWGGVYRLCRTLNMSDGVFGYADLPEGCDLLLHVRNLHARLTAKLTHENSLLKRQRQQQWEDARQRGNTVRQNFVLWHGLHRTPFCPIIMVFRCLGELPNDWQKLSDITEELVTTALAQMRPARPMGPDGIQRDIRLKCSHNLHPVLVAFYKRVEHLHQWPAWLTTVKFVYLSKPSTVPKPENLRPIALASHVYKLWAQLCKPVFDEMVPSLGNTPHGMHADIGKAFDGVPHAALQRVLLAWGAPAHMVCLVLQVYAGKRWLQWTDAAVEVHGIVRGIAPGCPL